VVKIAAQNDPNIDRSKLINFAVPDTIDPRVINLGNKLSLFKKLENLTLAINSAQVIAASLAILDCLSKIKNMSFCK
jgi:hypothetical protein